MDTRTDNRHPFLHAHKYIVCVLLSMLLVCLGSNFVSPIGAREVSPVNDVRAEWVGIVPDENNMSVSAPLRVSSAPGYCPSNGGSLLYEEIGDVVFTRLPGDRLKVDVVVQLNNPTNCQPGDPCPEYWNYPERVSLWVDWNKSLAWNSMNEVVINNRPEWYLSSFSNMPFSTIVDTPGTSSGLTYGRVALGWDYEPVNPCQLSWVWGDVEDHPLDLTSLSTPFSNVDISVKGRYNDSMTQGPTFQEKPQTGALADYEATIDLLPNVTVHSCKWRAETYDRGAGDLVGVVSVISPTRVLCKASRIPDARDVDQPAYIPYGEDRVVQLILGYAISGVAAISPVVFDHTFDLYFGKWDDAKAGARVPSWFVWWGADGAVPELKSKYSFESSSLTYKKASGGGAIVFDDGLPKGYAGAYAENMKGTGDIKFGAAGSLNRGGLTFSTCYTESDTWGIETMAGSVRHEGYHRSVDYRRFVGDWQSPPLLHNDTDKLPNDYEIQLTGTQVSPGYTNIFIRAVTTDPSNPDTCNVYGVAPIPIYATIGDQELEARVAAGALANSDSTKDWANPGARSGWTSGGDPDFHRW